MTNPIGDREAGQALIEFALASFLFFATVFGIVSFGLAVFRYNMVADLAQEGARRASVCGPGKLLSSSDCNVSTYVSSRSAGLAVTTTTTPTDLTTLIRGDTVAVLVSHDFPVFTRLVPGGTLHLQSTAKMISVR
jgi:Flp pilus assembly protein TadG